MINNQFLKGLAIAFTALFIVSCDKDYNSIGSDIVGNEHFLFEEYRDPLTVKIYNQKINAVQTNGLPINQLGINSNPVFGKTKANFVTQLTLNQLSPTFNSGIVVDSVVLTVPYFSTKTSTESSGRGVYKLDSIFTTNSDKQIFEPIDLKVYRNGYTLSDFNPNDDFITSQKYYSDEDSKFVNNIASIVLNNSSNTSENTAFVPSKKEYVKKKVVNNVETSDIESRNSPRMRLKLDKDYFKTVILDAAKDDATKNYFTSNSNFKTYFKGLYFQTNEVVVNKYTSMSLDFSKGDVTIYYKQHITNGDNSPNPALEMKSLVLNMSGQRVNLFDVSGNTFPSVVTNPDRINGDPKIYLKGGQGSLAFVELFSGTQLKDLRDKKYLINDASLYFNVDAALGDNYNHPKRIYLFDANNDRILYDYSLDSSEDFSNSKNNKSVFGGILEKDGLGNRKYRIRITDHIRRILAMEDSKYEKENVRLGLVVTENINNTTNVKLRDKISLPTLPSGFNKDYELIPSHSIINSTGTVLYGNNNPDNPLKDVQFKIYYTKPN